MPILPVPGMTKTYQWLLPLLFALGLSVLTFATSFAEAPYSEFLPSVTTAP